MITEAEVRRIAATMNVDPMVIDLDYSLGWFLLGMARTGDLSNSLRFKGGTCLRKCYFPQYRFSEDLDFTATKYVSSEEMGSWIQRTASWVTDHDGPDFQIQPINFEVVDDEYGSESYQARVYYRGPLRWGGSPRTVRLDITRHEKLFFPAAEQEIIHQYSDQDVFSGITLSCYCLEEVISEKIRAIGGQRRFAVSRDLYDIYNLIMHGVNLEIVEKILPEKFEARGLSLQSIDVIDFERRRHEFELDWERRLSYLVQSRTASFALVWDCVIQLVRDIDQHLKQSDANPGA